jgi:hypothetical protein
MSEAWATLEGHVVNGVFPLRRYLGSSDHSGVFLTEFAGREPSEVALKLVRATPSLADSQLSRWLTASGLDHPHLLRLLDAGRCQVDGLHYLYAVMEYADQNLAQLLEHRALTEDEAREMLVPTLQALAFLHDRKFVHGQLKPSNILVVGDRLKLASDTIRPVGEARDSINAMSVYDPPEARDGSCSGAGDIWALGVALCEALTRRQPSGLRDGGGSVVLPPYLSPAFRELVARCLSHRPDDRPNVAELEAWVCGQPTAPAPAAALQPVAIALPGPAIPQPIAAQPAAPVPAVSETVASQGTSAGQPSKRRALPLILGAVIVLALGWAGMRLLRSQPGFHSTLPPRLLQHGFQTPAPLRTPNDAERVVSSGPPPSPAGADAAVAVGGSQGNPGCPATRQANHPRNRQSVGAGDRQQRRYGLRRSHG